MKNWWDEAAAEYMEDWMDAKASRSVSALQAKEQSPNTF
jgi:hypothetical protein